MAYAYLNTYTGVCTNVLGNTINNSEFKVDVYYEQSIINNTTSLQIKPYIIKNGHGESVTWYFKLDGQDYYYVFCNTYVNNRVNGYTDSLCATKTVSHNADGTKTFTLDVSVETSYEQGANANLNNVCTKWGRLNVNVTLPTIPRASEFTLPSSFKMGTTSTITISPYVSSFRHNVRFWFGNASGSIGSNISTSCNWTPSKNLAEQIPNNTNGVGTIRVETYQGNTLVGSKDKTFTLYVSDDMVPSFTEVTATGIDLLSGEYVQSKSRVTCSIVNATGSYGSTITNYKIIGHCLNHSHSSNASATSTTFTEYGSKTYTATITDSRGRTATKTTSIDIREYFKPIISNAKAFRCDVNGNELTNGTYARVQFQGIIASINNVNEKKMYVDQIEPNTNDLISTITNYTDTPSYNFEYITPLVGGMVENKRYAFKIGIDDSYCRVTQTLILPVATCIMNIEKQGVGIGKYYEKGALDVGGDIFCSSWLTANEGIGATRIVNPNSGSALILQNNGEISYDGKYLAQTKATSWTPYLALGNGTVFTSSDAVGQYTVLGDYIWFQCRVIAVAPANVDSNSNSPVRIYGLPYVGEYNFPACSVGWCSGFNAGSAWTGYGAYIEDKTSSISLAFTFSVDNIGTWQLLRDVHLNANSTVDVNVSGIYRWR